MKLFEMSAAVLAVRQMRAGASGCTGGGRQAVLLCEQETPAGQPDCYRVNLVVTESTRLLRVKLLLQKEDFRVRP